ncbi:hypothetical protein [Pantanalinema sp. GBBB05]|uniref:hypothetical protein n=1 Tax=Pantanalinema sp. GBBB05 TaxID=2604139 RepID=UPI001D9FB369|nr:hypothetical protein [Pantanalinema sp. GBBB05]
MAEDTTQKVVLGRLGITEQNRADQGTLFDRTSRQCFKWAFSLGKGVCRTNRGSGRWDLTGFLGILTKALPLLSLGVTLYRSRLHLNSQIHNRCGRKDNRSRSSPE